jgi:hypothetical protein
MGTFSKKAAATLLVSALLGVGCTKHQDDEAIAQDVESKLAADPVAKSSSVSVTTKDGNVTLKGTVKDPATQQRVDQIAREEPGAKRVADETTVVAIEKPKPEPIIVPAGTALTVTVDQALNSKTSQAGQAFLATSAQPVTVDGKTAIPKGSTVRGTVVIAKEQGKIKGEGELALSLKNIAIYGQSYAIQTDTLDSAVKGKGKRTAATTGGGAAGGALIGGLAGGGKGAGIGAAVGAVGGLVGGTLTGNKQVEVPAESALTFTLSQPLTLPPHE